jgi:hypothetical protein
MLAIGTLCFGISLFVLRIPIQTINVFFIIGVPLVALWLYVDAKSKQQKKITTTVTRQSVFRASNDNGATFGKTIMLNSTG